MKSLIFLFVFVFSSSCYLASQTYSATLLIEEVEISNITKGNEIILPIKVESISGGKIMGFQLYIDFDPKYISLKKSGESSVEGLSNFHSSFTNIDDNWLCNENENFIAVIWHDPLSTGIEINDGDTLFDLVFIYKGGIVDKSILELVWSTVLEQEDGKIIRGETKMVSELLDYYDLSLINGKLIK